MFSKNLIQKRNSLNILLILILWGVYLTFPAYTYSTEDVIVDNFSSSTLQSWTTQPHSSISLLHESEGRGTLQWMFHSDGANPYGNTIQKDFPSSNWTKYTYLVIRFYSQSKPVGRIGLQIRNGDKIITLDDIQSEVKVGQWVQIRRILPEEDITSINAILFFTDGTQYPAGTYEFRISDIYLTSGIDHGKKPEGPALPSFSSQPLTEQIAIRNQVAPPPLNQRSNPYSTPMYYMYSANQTYDHQQHSDWQEVLIRDWAELGMTKLHLYLYPGQGNYTMSTEQKVGIQEFVRLCKKYGIRIGVRVDLAYTQETVKTPGALPEESVEASYWVSHPDNPKNEIGPWLEWLKSIVTMLKGQSDYYVLGDEVTDTNLSLSKKEQWNADVYMRFFPRVAEAIRSIDKKPMVSMYAASSGHWKDILELIKKGYANYGDAVAINHYDYKVVKGYMEELRKLVPNKKMGFLSNGVGYISSGDAILRSPPQDPYSKYSDEDQASMIARTMYSWWSVGTDVAPYYICMRYLETPKGKIPQWYGFFGFMDMVIDANKNASIRHYPGWFAYKTIANVFHDRPSFQTPNFKVEADNPHTDTLEAWTNDTSKELLIILWRSDKHEGMTNIHISSDKYGYPVKVDLMDMNNWSDVKATQEKDGVWLWDVPLSFQPTIIRLIEK